MVRDDGCERPFLSYPSARRIQTALVYTNVTRLEEACQIISTCTWQGRGGRRKLNLTQQIAEAFTVSIRNNVDAAKLLLAEKYFDYVPPTIFADEALETFFGKARQRSSRNVYIDVVDIVAAAKKN